MQSVISIIDWSLDNNVNLKKKKKTLPTEYCRKDPVRLNIGYVILFVLKQIHTSEYIFNL